ncbi:bifunctional lysylphosphatidylglycerol flippase/synthetase MprF [uncultured Ilyobacter sp.]|uniref:bifunctional lysylphosphatidylglycerol flippase/synthetase MprF n=1 Tax=uncultured Ilyobacter sp. TaxID=544433 RepID=UPI0029C7EFCB|nr:bifunctional lysylphosphatidylglycerol flippase/synthetase MprF [uncultured Ilyobacter sp.]
MKKKSKIFSFSLSILFFIAAIILIQNELANYSYRDIKNAVSEIKGDMIFLSVLLSIFSYILLIFLDSLALRHTGLNFEYYKIIFVSFVSRAFGNNLGISALSSSAIRFRFYSLWGVPYNKIIKLITFCYSTSWIGLIATGGFAFTFWPVMIPSKFDFFLEDNREIGIIFILLTLCYVLFSMGWKYINLHFEFPSLPISLVQISLSVFEWSVAGSVLYVLLPSSSKIHFFTFISIFVTGQLIGIISNLPGGIGAFEFIMISFLSQFISVHEILSGLILYRVIYYLLPLFFAVVLLGAYEVSIKKESFSGLTNFFDSFIAPFIPVLLAAGMFSGGFIMLLSGSTPSELWRIEWLGRFFPIATLEVSHFIGSITGFLLLILATGIKRRLNSAYFISIFLLIMGIISSLLKGLDYEEAFILFVILLLLIPSKKHFYRKASSLISYLSVNGILLIFLATASAIWIGIFSYKHVEYSRDLWWQFEIKKNAPRFLRSTLGIALATIFYALTKIMKPVTDYTMENSGEGIEDARKILMTSPKTYSNLVLMGDKSIVFDKDRDSFIMYGVSGKSMIAMGDPVGNSEGISELIWLFYEIAMKSGKRVVFYEVGTEYLNYYLDIGLNVLKIGEEAAVNLVEFSLVGGSRKGLRYTYNKLQKDGCSFRIIEHMEIESVMDELKEISDGWLDLKKGSEKKFSLGSFDKDYIKNFRIGVIEKEGKIMAFSNLWETSNKNELSVDLMRYRPSSPDSVMEFLFINLMLWGKENDYKWFNLGMAPLSGIEGRELSTFWNRFGNFVFNLGGHFYNFKGLRSYKDKFSPLWHPKYIVFSGDLSLLNVLKDVYVLVSGGVKEIIKK